MAKAAEVLNEVVGTPEGISKSLLDKSVCVGVIPSFKKAAFGIGGGLLAALAAYHSFLLQLVVFVLMIVAATAAYLALAWLLRCEEVDEVYGIATRRDRESSGAPTTME